MCFSSSPDPPDTRPNYSLENSQVAVTQKITPEKPKPGQSPADSPAQTPSQPQGSPTAGPRYPGMM